MQHRLLLAVTGRALEPAAGRCMFAGALLDELERLLRTAVQDPPQVARHSMSPFFRDHLIERLRRFMDHFEKVSMPPMPPRAAPPTALSLANPSRLRTLCCVPPCPNHPAPPV